MLLVKIHKSVVIGNIELMPIIKPCALELPIVDLKAKRTYEMKRGPRGRAGARDIARILRNLGLVKHYIYLFISGVFHNAILR
jgi:hypothetical protein